VWGELRAHVRGELASVRELARLVIDRADEFRRDPPDAWDLAAIGGLLHSFYLGVERVFRAIGTAVDHSVPTGDRWHAELLDAMRRKSQSRRPVISDDLSSQLHQYLGFRHVYRSNYPRQLDWSRVAPLVDDLEGVTDRFDREIIMFLDSLQP
jgi:hypothetical protein